MLRIMREVTFASNAWGNDTNLQAKSMLEDVIWKNDWLVSRGDEQNLDENRLCSTTAFIIISDVILIFCFFVCVFLIKILIYWLVCAICNICIWTIEERTAKQLFFTIE